MLHCRLLPQCARRTATDRIFDIGSDVVGNLFVSDQSNQVIRRIGKDGLVKTVAGNCPATPGFGCR